MDDNSAHPCTRPDVVFVLLILQQLNADAWLRSASVYGLSIAVRKVQLVASKQLVKDSNVAQREAQAGQNARSDRVCLDFLLHFCIKAKVENTNMQRIANMVFLNTRVNTKARCKK